MQLAVWWLIELLIFYRLHGKKCMAIFSQRNPVPDKIISILWNSSLDLRKDYNSTVFLAAAPTEASVALTSVPPYFPVRYFFSCFIISLTLIGRIEELSIVL